MQNLTFFGSPVVKIPIISFFLNHHHHWQCPPLFPPHHCCLLATITLLSPSLMASSPPHLSPTTRTARRMWQCHITNWMGTKHIGNSTGGSRCHVTGCNVASIQWTTTSLSFVVVVYGSTQHKSFIPSIPTNVANDDYTTPPPYHTTPQPHNDHHHDNDWWCTLNVTTTEVVTKWWTATSVAVCHCHLLGEIGPPPLLFFTNHPFQVPRCQQQCVATRQWTMTSIAILVIMVCELECSILAHALLFLYNK